MPRGFEPQGRSVVLWMSPLQSTLPGFAQPEFAAITPPERGSDLPSEAARDEYLAKARMKGADSEELSMGESATLGEGILPSRGNRHL